MNYEQRKYARDIERTNCTVNQVLMSLKREVALGDAENDAGICDSIKQSITTADMNSMVLLMVDWPEFSGFSVFPVKPAGIDSPDWNECETTYCDLSYDGLMWVGAYGGQRMRLLNWLIIATTPATYIVNWYDDEGRDYDEEFTTLDKAVVFLEVAASRLDEESWGSLMAEPHLAHPSGDGREYDLETERFV